ncbi:unnamed protein product [Cylindrotheca closterium]|uniref:Prolylcarboxypeptidase n=1 Tax=Cylindrotheca closterium TaxID=2856 RepID=A0AAD2FSI9_9STRA|nr:unnamed protein product [Cylindrotheca closterium]
MPSNNSGYGSVAVNRSADEEKLLKMIAPEDNSVDHEGQHRPALGITSRVILSVLCVVACVALFIQDGGEESSITMSAKHKHKHHKNVLLNKHHDRQELYYEQVLDNMDPSNDETYSQRYYKVSEYWKGPGNPILVIIGGEGVLFLPMLYPWVNTGLAKEFGAFVLSPEHRFYGESQPLHNATNEELVQLATPDQALADAINLIQHVRKDIGCSLDKSSKDYCPVITFGGSYPGFLSALLRFRFPDIIDISYAASAPLDLYAQNVAPQAYFDKVSEVADIASPGCEAAVRDTLLDARDELTTYYTSVKEAAEVTGFCAKTFPDYMETIEEFISETITYLVPAVFADFNMFYYPPGPKTALERACQIFQDPIHAPLKKISLFYDLRGEVNHGLDHKPKCFDLSLELPSGPNATIRSADSSGSGAGFIGEIWEFQCCKDLIVRASYSEQSMFIPRPYSPEWHREHCEARFEGVPFQPYRMVREWGYDDLSQASRILFTNGLRDGWSTSSILSTDNPNLAVINLPNGAHHSDLSMHWPNPADTDDIVEGHKQATVILQGWLDDIKAENSS